MREINCYIPIKLCVTGRLSDAQLDELGESLARALVARIAFAERTIAVHTAHMFSGGSELVREHYDPAQESVAPPEYSIPSYRGGGKRAKVALKKRQRPAAERVSLAIFADFAAAYDKILSFYPDPKPRGNTMFGVYGVLEQDFRPYVFFVSGIIQEGANRDQPFISLISLVDGKIVKDRYVATGAGNIPIEVSANERCKLRFLISPETQKGVKFNAKLRRQSGRVTPVFMPSETHTKWRGKVIRFGVATSDAIIEVTGEAPPALTEEPKTKRTPPWNLWYGGRGLPAEPLEGEPEWLWRWYGWFDMQPAEVRLNPLVQAVFADWEGSGKWEDFNLLWLFHLWVPRFYKAFCQKLALDMLATSRKNMSEFLAWLAQNETEWKTRFATQVRVLREDAEWLDPITYRRAQLEERKKDLEDIIRFSVKEGQEGRQLRALDELGHVKESLRQLEATRTEEDRVTALFKLVQEMEPHLVLLTIRAGKTTETLESALVWASKEDPDTLLLHVRQQVEWLINKSHEAEREIQNDADAAWKLRFVQTAANAQLAGWLQAKDNFRESIERLINPDILTWIGLGIGLLVLTFLFPPLGIGLSAAISIPMAYSSVERARQLSRLSGTRLAQYGFEPLVSKEEYEAAVTLAVLDVFFALLDIGVLTSAGVKSVRKLVLSSRLEKAAGREAAGALGQALERFLIGWRRFDLWPAELTDSIRRQLIDHLGSAPEDLVQAVQRELLVRYERRLLEVQNKFQKALEAGDVGELQSWLMREFPDAQQFFTDLVRREFAPGSSLYDNTVSRALAGHPPLPAPEALAFLGDAPQAQLEAIAHELGPLAELLTPNRLYPLGRSAGVDYWTLARKLNTLLSRVDGPELVLARLEDLLVARPDARHILSALEGTANPRPILEALTPEVLNLESQLIGGVHELFEAMSRTSARGEVIRLLMVVDEQGVQKLLREILRPNGRTLIQRWEGLTHGWQYEPRLRPPGAPPVALAVEAAEEAITQVRGARPTTTKPIEQLNDRLNDLLTKTPSVAAPSAEEVAQIQARLQSGVATIEDYEVLLRKAVHNYRSVRRAEVFNQPAGSWRLPDPEGTLSYDTLDMVCGQGRDVSSAALAGYAKWSGKDIQILRHHTLTVFEGATENRHSFSVVIFPDGAYIVDPTFAQFLKPGLISPAGGDLSKFTATVLRSDPEAVKMLNDLVQNGFIPLTPKNAELYALGLGVNPAKAAELSKRLTMPAHAIYGETVGKGISRGLTETLTEADILTRKEMVEEYSELITSLKASGDPLNLVPELTELLKLLH